MLNACQARFLNPRLVYAKLLDDTEPGKVGGPAFVQFGTEGGFLPAPVYLDGTSPGVTGGPTPSQLLLAPAERADLIVDFRNVPVGSTLILIADAPAPYPEGDSIYDFFPGNPDTPSSNRGFGPNTRTLLQIRVKARSGPADPPISLPVRITPTDPFVIAQVPGVPTPNPKKAKVRRADPQRGLRRVRTPDPVPGHRPARQFDARIRAGVPGPPDRDRQGRDRGGLGDRQPHGRHAPDPLPPGQRAGPVAPGVRRGALHGRSPTLAGPAVAPDPNELGWKETVRMNPGEVTRVWMRFDLPVVPFTVPASPRLVEDYGIHGAEYVWHCHILDHEEHDMMRPLVVV